MQSLCYMSFSSISALYSVPERRSWPQEREERSNGGHRECTLKDILKRESNVNAEHYAMIQVCHTAPFLPVLTLPTGHYASAGRSVPRYPPCVEGDELTTVCTEEMSWLQYVPRRRADYSMYPRFVRLTRAPSFLNLG